MKILVRWVVTVRGLIERVCAICALERPAATNRSTSNSRGVNPWRVATSGGLVVGLGIIAAAATEVLLVARNDCTRLKELEEMRDCYERLGIRVTGLVANEH